MSRPRRIRFLPPDVSTGRTLEVKLGTSPYLAASAGLPYCFRRSGRRDLPLATEPPREVSDVRPSRASVTASARHEPPERLGSPCESIQHHAARAKQGERARTHRKPHRERPARRLRAIGAWPPAGARGGAGLRPAREHGQSFAHRTSRAHGKRRRSRARTLARRRLSSRRPSAGGASGTGKPQRQATMRRSGRPTRPTPVMPAATSSRRPLCLTGRPPSSWIWNGGTRAATSFCSPTGIRCRSCRRASCG